MSDVRIYVACLASYNNGRLHGAWIDADQSADDIGEEISKMLRSSPYPNVMVECPENHSRPTKEIQGWLAKDCATCKGKGEVPSAEEYAIHDYDGLPSSLGEYPSLDNVAEIAALVSEHEYELVNGLVDHYGSQSLDSVKEALEDSYQGAWDSLADYVQNFWEDCGDMPSAPNGQWWHPSNYTDWERMAHDLEISGDIFTIEADGKIHIFNNQ